MKVVVMNPDDMLIEHDARLTAQLMTCSDNHVNLHKPELLDIEYDVAIETLIQNNVTINKFGMMRINAENVYIYNAKM
jgi:hypothetical protein